MADVMRGLRNGPLLFLATLFLLVAILSLAQRVIIPVVLAALLSFLLFPVVKAVQRSGLSRVPAVVMVATSAFLLLGMILWTIGSQAKDLAEEIPRWQRNVEKKIQAMREGEPSALGKFLRFGRNVTEEALTEDTPEEVARRSWKEYSSWRGVAADVLGEAAAPWGSGPLAAAAALDPARVKGNPGGREPVPVAVQADPGRILSFFVSTAQEVIRVVASVALVIVLVFVFLIYREELRDRFLRLTGSNRLTITTKALDEAAQRISEYMLRKSFVNGAYGVVISVGLYSIGIPFAVVWGFLIAVLRFIPGLGLWLSVSPPLVLSLIAFEGWWVFLLVAGLYLVTELTAMNVVEPRVVGPQVGLLPVAVMISLSFWTWLWGPIGLFLAIPITVCLAVLGKYVPALWFLNVLLSNQPAMDTPSRYYQRMIASDQDEAAEAVEAYLEGHTREEAYDDLLVPAFSQARGDMEKGALGPDDFRFLVRATREILDDVELELAATGAELEVGGNGPIIGCPVRDEADRLALRMVQQSLRVRGCPLEVGEADRLSSETVAWAAARRPNIVCVVSVGPGGLAQARYVCKRLRLEVPAARVFVGRLGSGDRFEEEEKILLKSGADQVLPSVARTAAQLYQAYHLTPVAGAVRP